MNKFKRMRTSAAMFLAIAIASWSLGATTTFAFGVLGTFTGGNQFSVIFDGNVASSTVTSSSFVLGAASATFVGTPSDQPTLVFGEASGTLPAGSIITVSSSITNTTNATNTVTAPQRLLPSIKIAEVRAGTTMNNMDSYVMLYNMMGMPWTASGTLHLHVMRPSAQDTDIPLSFTTTTIGANDFFLIASGYGFSGSLAPDATWNTSTLLIASNTTAVYINTSSTPRSGIIDKVEWGAAPQFTTSSDSSSTFISATATTTLNPGVVLVRKAAAGSTSSTMAAGGSESNKGNGYDSRDNGNDFVLIDPASGLNALIKNSYSPPEFAFGGGQQDTSQPIVMGSFPSGSPGEMVPTDLAFVGFGVNKTLDPSTVNTSTVSLVVQGQSANLCSNVTYMNTMSQNQPPGTCTLSSHLTAGTTYVFTINGASSTPNVRDFSGNPLNQPPGTGMGQHGDANHDYQLTFSPSSGFTITPQVPPNIIGTYPSPGSSNIPTNITKVFISFSQAMDNTSFGGVTLTTGGGGNVLNNAGLTMLNNGQNVSIPINGALTSGANYMLSIPTSVKNSNGVNLMSSYTASFAAGSSADATGPQVLGHLPNIATGVPVNAIDIHAATDDALDASTVSSGTVKVRDAMNNLIPGTVTYDPMAREIVWVGNNVFQTNASYTVTLSAAGTSPSIKNVSGIDLQDTDGNANNLYQFSFTTQSSPDTTGPGILFANANGFSAAVTFDEAVKDSEAQNISNYAVTSNGTPVSLSSFNGNTVSYDAIHRTATINNLALTPSSTFSVTVSNVHDLSGNLIDPSKSSFSGTVQQSGFNGGSIGVGGGFIAPAGDIPTGFSSSQFGFVPQPNVRPFNTLAGFSSGYGVDLPISKQIPAGGKIVLTFPSSFTLANAALDSFSPANNDINGPGLGTVTIASTTGDDTAHTVTVILGATPTQSNSGDTHDFLHFDLSGVGNSPVPNASNGYTVDIRTISGTSALESFTSQPFFVTAAGGGTLTVNLTATGATGGTAKVYLFSPQTGPLSTSTAAFSAGSAAAVFSGIPNGTYQLMTDPIISLTGGAFLGQAMPLPVSVNGSSSQNVTLTGGGSLASVTVNIHASGVKKVSTFAGGSSGFVDTPVNTSNGTTTATLYLPSGGDYTVGVGPQMDKTFSGPPPAPDYVMPQPIQVHASGTTATPSTVNFDLVDAGKTINGTVVDDSGKAIANANVYAYSPQGGFGTFGQSGSDGSFKLNVAAGSYKIGASSPGFPSAQESAVVVDQSGNAYMNGSGSSTASVTISLTKPSTKISGAVTDGTNAVQGAQVWAYCDPSVNGNSCFGPNGHAEAQTDSSGAYSLYVGNGSWRVGAYIPNYGQQPEISVVIASSSVSNKNFSPPTGNTNSVSGEICTNGGSDCTGGTPLSGVNVRIQGTDSSGRFYSNMTISASDGTYAFSSVPSGAGSSYTVSGFAPTLGQLPQTAAFTVTGNVTSKFLVVQAGRTININVANNPAAFDLFMSLTNISSGISNFLSLHNNASGTIKVPNGSTYKIAVHAPGFSLDASNIGLTAGTASYSTSTGQLDLTSGSDAVTLSLTFPAATVISGVTKDASTSAAVANAWVDISNPSTGQHFGTQSDSSGTYSIAVADGNYVISAFAPNYLPNAKQLSVSGGTITFGAATTTASAVNPVLQKSSLTITGAITANNVPVAGAMVRGSMLGGGTSVVVAGTNGAYSLPVSAGTWTISAVADGYQSASYSSNPVVVGASSVSGININLTTTVNLGAPTAQPITPSQGGMLKNSSGTLQVTIPANALGSSANTGQVKVNETTNLVSTATARPIGNGQDIKAFDSSNNAVTNLNSNVTISLDIPSSTFSSSSITSTSTAGKLKLGYFDTSLNDWVPIASTLSYENSSGVEVTPAANLSNVDHISLNGTASHFSVFGAITPVDSLAPSAPTGVTAQASSSKAVVSWTAPTTNSDGSALTDLMEYEIYRDTSLSGSFATQVNSGQVASGTTSFTDTTVSNGTTYYYKVSAADTSGNESAKSAASSAATPAAASNTVINVSSGGGGGGSYIYQPVNTATTSATSTAANSTPTSTAAATSSSSTQNAAAPAGTNNPPPVTALNLNAGSSNYVLTKTLEYGSEGDEVRTLQTMLAQNPAIYPEGIISGYFGRLTKLAVERFQKKYGIETNAATNGLVGPATRQKLMEVLGSGAATAATPSLPASPEALRALITELQAQLMDLMKQMVAELTNQLAATKK